MARINISENGINMVFDAEAGKAVKLLHFSALPFNEKDITGPNKDEAFTAVEVQATGMDRTGERRGAKYERTSPADKAQLVSFGDTRNETGRHLAVAMEATVPERCVSPSSTEQVRGRSFLRTPERGEATSTRLSVTCHYQFYDGIPAVRVWTVLENKGTEDIGIEYVSSFALAGIEKEGLLCADDKLELRIPHNGWQRELHWNAYAMGDLGMSLTQDAQWRHSSNVIGIGNTGNWSTKDYVPMGFLTNRETGTSLFWQIEHNGSWYWELGDQAGHLYLRISGPTEHQSGWWINLRPGQSFTSVPVCVGSVAGGFNEALAALTQYRRAIRRPNEDNQNLPVIFNDYMNCLFGDPTTAKEIPLIDAAAAAGCEYYVIDCGWYSDGGWWDSVGEWLPSKARFPDGIKKLTDYIHSKGMIPGLWIEIEVMGIKCPAVEKANDTWFFMRHGKRITDRSRYQLDFRNPVVREYATKIIDRLVNEYGVGYFKIDYNIEPGLGTDYNADSAGAGLLDHERAYLTWLDDTYLRHKGLVIENCSSGGLRMDYALLSRCSLQSTSDTTDYKVYSTIAANAPSAVTPEQAAVWSYPMEKGDEEETIFNMVNAMLLRIHQSGRLDLIDEKRSALVLEGIQCYKKMRHLLRDGTPFWPLGLAHYDDPWASLAIRSGRTTIAAVWRRGSHSANTALAFPYLKGADVKARCLYPNGAQCSCQWNRVRSILSVTLPVQVSARIFELEVGE